MSKPAKIVLMVEDNLDHAEFIRRALKGEGITIVHVEDGEAALYYLKNGHPRPTFVLLDVKLPKKDGFEVLAVMRATEHLRDLPVVMLSTSFSPHEIKRAYTMGANSFVTKPTDFEQFTKKVSMIRDFWFHVAESPLSSEANG